MLLECEAPAGPLDDEPTVHDFASIDLEGRTDRIVWTGVAATDRSSLPFTNRRRLTRDADLTGLLGQIFAEDLEERCSTRQRESLIVI